MSRTFLDSLTLAGMVCWIVCFWWMHRISSRQDSLLQELHNQGRRIEALSREDHDLVKELHPKMQELQSNVGEVVAAVKTS